MGLSPSRLLKLCLFRHAPKVEISAETVFVGLRLVHEGNRDLLCELSQAIDLRGFIAHYDPKEDRRRTGPVFSEAEIDVVNLLCKPALHALNGGPDLLLMNEA